VGAEDAAPAFLFATCQVGAEAALKAELARAWPAFRFAYSRPGFLTFKLPEGHTLPDDFDLGSVFARAYGFTLGKVTAEALAAAADEVWRIAADRRFAGLHVWQRDMATMGHHGFEPHVTPAALAAEQLLREAYERRAVGRPLERAVEPGQLVLDCVLVEPHEWWLGFHRSRPGDSCHPGGLRSLAIPEEVISRAYVKMAEALAWSGLPIKRGERFVEIGCAPGGASQYLLEQGLNVIGIDPAAVDERIASHAKFTHVRKRGADVRRREFRGIHWLAADMNVAPEYTLDTVEAIVTHEATSIRGLLLTLKLPDWNLVEEIPNYLNRIKKWGYPNVRARQLAHNRQEICVAATKRKPSR